LKGVFIANLAKGHGRIKTVEALEGIERATCTTDWFMVTGAKDGGGSGRD
jgi:hypothetical protein